MTPVLSDSQKARIERNRQKALLRRQARQASQPYMQKEKTNVKSKAESVDTCGGFLLEEKDEDSTTQKVVHPPGAILVSDHTFCDECGKDFNESFLSTNFSLNVCDVCRDADDSGKYKLITKSTAKERYLLKDVDIDKREPLLQFITKANPHNNNWGSMKLYLQSQIAERAIEIWGTEEAIEKERLKRDDDKEKMKQKRFDKKVKELRKTVRSSLFKKDLSGHEHEYTQEVFNEEEDNYSKTCKQCGHIVTYEKM